MGWFIGAAIDGKIGQTHFNDFVISLYPHLFKPSKWHLDLSLRKEMYYFWVPAIGNVSFSIRLESLLSKSDYIWLSTYKQEKLICPVFYPLLILSNTAEVFRSFNLLYDCSSLIVVARKCSYCNADSQIYIHYVTNYCRIEMRQHTLEEWIFPGV